MARYGTLAPLICALLSAAPAAGQPPAPSLAERLAAAGIQSLEPPAPAPDFTLPLLGGGELTLSTLHGRWVVLTFFATWCGPCRTEMPTLERLHGGLGDSGPAIVAVSLDRDRASLEAFADELGLGLPVAWDRTGETGDRYLASSIPITYLIDPRGGVAGVARGARDWTTAEPLLAALAAAPSETASEPRYAATGPIELPEVLAPPSAEWSLPDGPQRPGRPFTLEVLLRWSGQLADYLPQPPRLTLPEGVRQERVEARSGSEQGGQLVRYRIELVADRAGSFALDPIELRYLPAFAAGPSTELVAGPTIEIAAPASGRRAAALGAAALVALGLAALWWRRRRAPAAPPPAPPWERLRAELDRARGLRLAGESAAAFETLAAAAAELESPAERADLEERLEAVRFGGSRPGGGELEAIERRLTRALEKQRPDPEADHRGRLRLRSRHPAPNPEETRG